MSLLLSSQPTQIVFRYLETGRVLFVPLAACKRRLAGSERKETPIALSSTLVFLSSLQREIKSLSLAPKEDFYKMSARHATQKKRE